MNISTSLKRKLQALKNLYHLGVALVANIYYGFPSRSLKVIGVTGTDGKTTTTHAIYHLLSRAGRKVSLISTVYAKIGDKVYDTGLHTTTPDPFLVQGMLAKARAHGDEFFILETTSHALDQNRVWGVRFAVSVITNVTHEHLDYHAGYGDYLAAKGRIMRMSGACILNKDDSSFDRLKKLPHSCPIMSYGFGSGADFSRDFAKDVPGLVDFNRYNFLAAYAVVSRFDALPHDVPGAFRTFPLPQGRLDLVHDGPFRVMVDFAHTPNAISVILEAMKTHYLVGKGRIIHVFGSAGLRDASKRPLMGKASGTFASLVVLTEEDYRTEDPEAICGAIAEGLKGEGFRNVSPKGFGTATKQYAVVIARDEAIRLALSVARPGDIVIVTGKGHEKSLCRGAVEHPWNDGEFIKQYFHDST